MRIRITFSKTDALRYIGNLDLHALWERAVRRAGLPLAYSQGFHPQPKIYLASALPLGFSSRCEVADLRLTESLELSTLSDRLQSVMPSGIRIINLVSVDEQAPALQTQLLAAEYEATLTEILHTPDHSNIPEPNLSQRVDELLAQSTLLRERRGKAYDLRPLIEKLTAESEYRLFMRLTAREAATGRPEEVLDALGLSQESTRIERINLIFQG